MTTANASHGAVPDTSSRPRGRRNPGLELFVDLVFVLCVSQFAELLHHEPTWHTAARVLLLFVPVWWTWTGVTFALNRFPADDARTTVLLLGAGAAAGLMAIAIPAVPGASDVWFATGYLTVRLIIAVIYLRVRGPERRLARFYAGGFTLTAAAWLVSIVLPEPVRITLWVAALCVDIAVPALADRQQRMLPVDEKHLPDRFAAFAIIVLGEAAVNTVNAVGSPLQPATAAVLAESFVVAALLWWGFFDRHAWQLRYRMLSDKDTSGRVAYVICAYLHFPLVAGVMVIGAGAQLAAEHPHDAISRAAAAMISGGVIAYLLTLNAMSWVLHVPRAQSLARARVLLILALAALLLVGHGLTPPVWLAGCLAVLVAHTVLNARRVTRVDRPSVGQSAERDA